MRLAICSQGEDLTSPVDQRFGRCPFFVILDTDSGEIIKSMANSGAAAPGGAGSLTTRLLLSEQVEAVVVGNVGPNAATALGAAGIKVYGGITGTVEETLALFRQGKLAPIVGATVNSHFGYRQ